MKFAYPTEIFTDSTESASIVDTKDVDDNEHVRIAMLQNELERVRYQLANIEDRTMGAQYISAEEFEPMRKIVYGLISMILIAVVGSLISLTISA